MVAAVLDALIALGDPSMSAAKPFIDMATRISGIDVSEFAGAVVIVPPDGEPIAFLTTDPKPDLLQFLSAVKTRVEVLLTAAMQSASQQDPWGGRR
jgi:hypothetical protein